MTRGIAVALLLLTSCASSTPRVFHHRNGARAAEGAILSRENYLTAETFFDLATLPWIEYQRTGTWRYWYPTGQLRAVVHYSSAEYTDCCVTGFCVQTYERLVGQVELFDESGRTLLKGEAGSRRRTIDTNCGPATITAPRVTLPADILPQLPPAM
jgi:hypothetical protein